MGRMEVAANQNPHKFVRSAFAIWLRRREAAILVPPTHTQPERTAWNFSGLFTCFKGVEALDVYTNSAEYTMLDHVAQALVDGLNPLLVSRVVLTL